MSRESPIFRPVRREELPEATGLFIESVQDLAKRNGVAPPPFTVENRLPVYTHVAETGIFWVAERGGRIAAIANAIVREDVWFLCGFWARPGLQGQGIGRPLLEKVRDEGRARGARREFVWSSIDFAALSLYLKLGMMPVCQILSFVGTPKPWGGPGDVGGYTRVPVDASEIADLDREALGFSRPEDQSFFDRGGSELFGVLSPAGRLAGYFRAQAGTIGPCAWREDQDGDAVLSLAFAEASRSSEIVRLAAAGINHRAISQALGRGLKIVTTAHLLTSVGIGRPERYVPSGPVLF